VIIDASQRQAGPAAEPSSREPTRAAFLAASGTLCALAGTLAVWAWQAGGYFGTALYPGTIVLSAVGAILAAFAPTFDARLRRCAILALAALALLGGWALLSALWSPAPDVAVEDGQRILTYGVIFGLGAFAVRLLPVDRIHLGMAAITVAAGVAGAITVVAVIHGDNLGNYLDIGTLDFPLGYRNANAAFFLIAVWPSVALAATPTLDWRMRGLALGIATLSLELGLLSQSRGSLIAGPLALAVYVGTSRNRAPAVFWLMAAALPALIVVFPLADLFHAAAHDPRPDVVEALHTAGRAALLGAMLSVVVGALAALASRRVPMSEAALAFANRAVTVATVAVVLAGGVVFVATTGDPFAWIGDKAKEFRTEGTPQFSDASSRFGGLKTGSSRYAIWKVALKDAGEEPLLGQGGGGFHYSYLEKHTSGPPTVRDAHSIELEVLSELGAPGLLLLITALGAACVGTIGARRISSEAAGLSTAALAAGTYWLAHTSIDWFWPYPAVTASALALLGMACGALPGPPSGRARFRATRMLPVALGVLALSVVPPYLSDRYVNAAFDLWRSDRAEAYHDLDRAAAWNPLADEPLLAAGIIANAVHDRARAISSFEQEANKRPEEWAAHYFLARLYANTRAPTALAQIREAERLNPLDPRIDRVRRRLVRASASGPGGTPPAPPGG
jgi:hypothetical protein